MSVLLVIWMGLAIALDRLLVVAPLDVKNVAKRALYYIILAPYLIVLYASQAVVNKTTWGATLTEWFKR